MSAATPGNLYQKQYRNQHDYRSRPQTYQQRDEGPDYVGPGGQGQQSGNLSESSRQQEVRARGGKGRSEHADHQSSARDRKGYEKLHTSLGNQQSGQPNQSSENIEAAMERVNEKIEKANKNVKSRLKSRREKSKIKITEWSNVLNIIQSCEEYKKETDDLRKKLPEIDLLKQNVEHLETQSKNTDRYRNERDALHQQLQAVQQKQRLESEAHQAELKRKDQQIQEQQAEITKVRFQQKLQPFNLGVGDSTMVPEIITAVNGPEVCKSNQKSTEGTGRVIHVQPVVAIQTEFQQKAVKQVQPEAMANVTCPKEADTFVPTNNSRVELGTNKKNKQLQEENASLKKKVENQERDAKIQRHEIEKLKEDGEKLKGESKNKLVIERSLSEKARELASAQETIRKQLETISQLHSQYEESWRVQEELRHENAGLRQVLEQKDSSSRSMEAKMNEISHLKETISQQDESSKHDSETIRKLKETISQHGEKDHERVSGLEAEINRLKAKVHHQGGSWKEQEDKMLREIGTWKERLMNAETSLANQKKAADDLKKRCEELEDEVDVWKGKTQRHDTTVQDLEEENKKLRRDIRKYKGDIESLEERIGRRNNTVQDLQEKIDKLNRDIKRYKDEIEKLKRRIGDLEEGNPLIKPLASAVEHKKAVVIPTGCKGDSRIERVMKSWLAQLGQKIAIHVTYKEGHDIGSDDGTVIMHCITTSSVARDVELALRKEKLVNDLDLVVVVWHHKATHTKFPRQSQDVLENTELLGRCQLICDAFFWDHTMYPCEQNQASIENIRQLLESRGHMVVASPPIPRHPHAEGVQLVLPQVSDDDDRVKPIFSQLMMRLKDRGITHRLLVKEGKDITHQDGIVILPCIAASRVGSDLSATLDKAKLDPAVRLVIIIFNHKAPHDCKIRVPTRDRLSDRKTVARCLLFADAVFWNGDMFQCDANDILMDELAEVLS